MINSLKKRGKEKIYKMKEIERILLVQLCGFGSGSRLDPYYICLMGPEKNESINDADSEPDPCGKKTVKIMGNSQKIDKNHQNITF